MFTFPKLVFKVCSKKQTEKQTTTTTTNAGNLGLKGKETTVSVFFLH